MVAHDRLAQERVQNGSRIREPGGLDHDAIEGWNFAAITPAQQSAQRGLEIVADAATDASALQKHDRFVDALDQ